MVRLNTPSTPNSEPINVCLFILKVDLIDGVVFRRHFRGSELGRDSNGVLDVFKRTKDASFVTIRDFFCRCYFATRKGNERGIGREYGEKREE